VAGDEPRTAFDAASRRSSNPAEESGSPPPSGKRQIGESRGEVAWLRPHPVKEWFAHNDDRATDIMMSTLMTRKLPIYGNSAVRREFPEPPGEHVVLGLDEGVPPGSGNTVEVRTRSNAASLVRTDLAPVRPRKLW
jgi:hypothetical protein